MSVARRPTRKTRHAAVPANHPPQLHVRPGWLLGALGLLLLAALGCAYASLCFLFYQGQWQLLYRPDETPANSLTPASAGLNFSALQFGPNSAGITELTGWWLPAKSATALSGTTVVYLHDGAESLSTTLPKLAWLHALGCTVFAIEYRGYGSNASGHPSESGMVEDATRALGYLTSTRHLPLDSIVVWGRGTGATIAAEAGEQQGPRLRLVLDDVNPPALPVLAADPRTRFLPLRLLLRDHLDAVPALRSGRAPKLFLEQVPGGDSRTDTTAQVFAQAAPPKQLAGAADVTAIRKFLAGGS